MDNLLKPDVGLMFWTIITFIGLLIVLKKFAWGPLIHSLNEREMRIMTDINSAEEGRKSVEEAKANYEKQLAKIDELTKNMLADADKEGRKIKDDIVQGARDEAKKIVEQTRAQLSHDKDRITEELKGEIANIAVLITEKLLKKSLDPKVKEGALDEAIQAVKDHSKEFH